MTIQEILEVHVVEVRRNVFTREEWPRCKCGWLGARVLAEDFDWEPAKRSHLAEVLDKHMQEARAQELETASAEYGEIYNQPQPNYYAPGHVIRALINRANEIRKAATNGR